MTYKSNQDPLRLHPESLIVMANGVLDDTYYDNIYAQKRREALRQVFEPMLHNVSALMLKGSLAALKGLGRASLEIMEQTAQVSRDMNGR